jgi:hypothetical protein
MTHLQCGYFSSELARVHQAELLAAGERNRVARSLRRRRKGALRVDDATVTTGFTRSDQPLPANRQKSPAAESKAAATGARTS